MKAEEEAETEAGEEKDKERNRKSNRGDAHEICLNDVFRAHNFCALCLNDDSGAPTPRAQKSVLTTIRTLWRNDSPTQPNAVLLKP